MMNRIFIFAVVGLAALLFIVGGIFYLAGKAQAPSGREQPPESRLVVEQAKPEEGKAGTLTFPYTKFHATLPPHWSAGGVPIEEKDKSFRLVHDELSQFCKINGGVGDNSGLLSAEGWLNVMDNEFRAWSQTNRQGVQSVRSELPRINGVPAASYTINYGPWMSREVHMPLASADYWAKIEILALMHEQTCMGDFEAFINSWRFE